MFKVKFEQNPALRSTMQGQLQRALDEATLAAAARIERKISKGPRTGKQYRDKFHPRRSSAPGEYPQEQLGALKRSVNYSQISSLVNDVGFFGDAELMAKAVYLEFTGEYSTGKGLRRPLWMLFEGKDAKVTLQQMATAMRKSLK